MAEQLIRQEPADRKRVDTGKQRIAFLWHVSRAIASEPLDVDAICRNLAQFLSSELADCCLIDLIREDQMVHRVALAHDGQMVRHEPPAPTRLDARIGVGLHKVSHTGRAEMSRDISAGTLKVLLGSSVDHMQAMDFRGYAMVPLAHRDDIFGAITLLSCRSEREIGPVELAMAQEVASLASLAIENALLHQETKRARAEADLAAQRLAFLVRASDLLSASLDYKATLACVARLAIPDLADCCVVHLVEENGEIHRVETAHRDPTIEQLVRNVQGQAPMGSVGQEAFESGRSVLWEAVCPDEVRRRQSATPGYVKIVEAVGPMSLIAVPLMARGRKLGTILLFVSHQVRRYDQQDVILAEELARRAALAVDNARLFREAQRAALIQQNLLTLTSHDLKNPLNVVLLAASFLDTTLPKGPEAQDWRRAAGNIHAAGERMVRLVGQLLDVEALARGDFSLDLERQPLGPMLDEIIRKWQPRALEKRLVWDVQTARPTPLLRFDTVRLGQVLHTLLEHAVRETREGGTLTVRLLEKAGRVEVLILDQGAELAADDLHQIFELLAVQGNRTVRDLSLPIAKGIVQAHGGQLMVASRPGEGSCFCVSLPTADA